MKPIEFKDMTLTAAKDQPPYLPFPIHIFNDKEGRIACCWKLSLKERLKLLFTGKIWHEMLTFNKKIQPQKLSVNKPVMKSYEYR